MKIVTETNLSGFDAWSGAKSTLAALDSDQCEQLEYMLAELYPDGMEDGELNDLLWFECDWIAEMLGYRDWEDLIDDSDEEEDEDEEEDW